MKKTASLLGGLLLVSFTTPAQLTLNQGESFIYSFQNMPDMGTVLGPHFTGGHFSLQLDPGTMQSGDLLLMEMFEGTAAGTAGAQRLIELPSADTRLASPDLWADKEGAVRVTAVNGSFTVNEMTMQRGDPLNPPDPLGIRHQLDGVTIIPVPEPSTFAIACLGLLAMGWKSLSRR